MIVLDYRDKRPIYEQVVEKLEHLIICGGLEPNSKLPSVRALALELSVNPNTIQRAYAQLETDGYIYTILGRGNYVTDKSEWQTAHFAALKENIRELFIQARDAGVPREDLRQLILSVYGEDKEEMTYD